MTDPDRLAQLEAENATLRELVGKLPKYDEVDVVNACVSVCKNGERTNLHFKYQEEADALASILEARQEMP